MSKIILNILAAALVGGAILLQDYALARNFGISATQDFYQFTFLVASNLWNVLSGGTYFAVAIPLLLNLYAENNEHDANKINRWFFAIYFLIILLICLLGYYYIINESTLFSINNYEAIDKNSTIILLIITIPLHLIASYFAVKVICQKLNYLVTITSSLIFLAIPLWGIFNNFNVVQAALLVCIGISAQSIILMLVIRSDKTNFVKENSHASSKTIRITVAGNIFELFKIIISALLIALLNWLIAAEYANQGTGEVSKFLYATKPSNMAAAFLTIVIANYLLASFSETAAVKDYRKLKKDIINAYKIVFAISLFCILFWYFVSGFFYQIMFFKSNVTEEVLRQIQFLSNIAIFQLPLYAMGVIAWRGLNALSRNSEILKASIASIILFYGLKIFIPEKYEHRILIMYICSYLLWSLYLILSLSIIKRNLIKN